LLAERDGTAPQRAAATAANAEGDTWAAHSDAHSDVDRGADVDRDADGHEDGDAPAERRGRGWRSRRLTLLVGIPLAILLVLVGGVGIAAWRIQTTLDHKISRFGDPFASIPSAGRPTKAASTGPTEAMNLLVFGSDSRISAGDPSQWETGAQRTDAIMLVHIPADRSGAYVVSIPRDSWVPIPGHGVAKINAAFSWGGPALAIQTVESLTGVTIDHMVVTDFTGFARLTDLLGGVKITVPKATGMGNGHGTIAAGTYTMDGTTALAYVRERYTLPHGDFDRVKRQQNWIRAIMKGAASSGVLRDPQRVYDLLDATASSISTDSTFSIGEMRDLILSLRDAGPGGTRFLTVPTKGTGWSPDHEQSIVVLDQAKADGLWQAMADDKVATWLAESAYPTLGTRVG
jgi:LCP family protein required for cell wall assembly